MMKGRNAVGRSFLVVAVIIIVCYLFIGFVAKQQREQSYREYQQNVERMEQEIEEFREQMRFQSQQQYNQQMQGLYEQL